jgi:hypothetical protein
VRCGDIGCGADANAVTGGGSGMVSGPGWCWLCGLDLLGAGCG